MSFSWFVALRYLRSDVSQTALVLAAVSVGVTVIVFLSALITGLQTSLIDKTLGSQAHVTLTVPEELPRALAEERDGVAILSSLQKGPQRLRSIDGWPQLVGVAEATPGVIAASAAITGAGFAEYATAKRPIMVRGVEPERFVRIIDLEKRIVRGRFDLAGTNVVIGSKLAADLGVTVGDKLRIVTSEGRVDVAVVAGVFELGNLGVDGTWMLTTIRQAQSLFALPGGATTIELKVGEVFEAEEVAREVERRTELSAESWMEKNAELLSGLSAQSSSKTMIQFFVVVAVALGIASVLIVSVVQKSREIGILRAVGTPRRRVLEVFLLQGGLLGALGSVIGCALGTLFSRLFEGIALDPSGNPRFPIQVDAELLLGASAIAIAVGLLAALLPARRASRLDPATAIRNG